MVENRYSKNFSLYEVIHRDPDKLMDQLVPIASHAQGMIQGFRNHLRVLLGKEIRINITSGYRSPSYNSQIGGSVNSYHMWRFDNENNIIWALDITSPDLDQDELYEAAAKFFTGEVYKHGSNGLVHVTDYGADEDLGELF